MLRAATAGLLSKICLGALARAGRAGMGPSRGESSRAGRDAVARSRLIRFFCAIGRPDATRPDPTRPKHCCHYTRDCSAALACCTTCPCCSCTPRLLATTRRPRTCMLRPDAHWHQHGDREVLRSGRKRSLFVAVLLGCRSVANAAARFDAPSTTAADARPSVASHSAMA